MVAVAGVVLLGTLQGILVAIVVSLVALAYQVADPPVYVLGRKPAPTSSDLAPRNIPRTRPSPVCSCCGRRGGCSSRMPSVSERRSAR